MRKLLRRAFHRLTIPGWISAVLMLMWRAADNWGTGEFILGKLAAAKPVVVAVWSLISTHSGWIQVGVTVFGLAWVVWAASRAEARATQTVAAPAPAQLSRPQLKGVALKGISLDITPEGLKALSVEFPTAPGVPPLLETGKLIELTGPVGHVSRSKSFVRVTSEGDLQKPTGLGFAAMHFAPVWAERLSVLKQGEYIRVRGQIQEVTEGILNLTNCELL